MARLIPTSTPAGWWAGSCRRACALVPAPVEFEDQHYRGTPAFGTRFVSVKLTDTLFKS